MSDFTFSAPLWRYSAGDGAWFFVSLPEDVADEIESLTAGSRHGFGSVRVEVRVGGSTWRTSLFPATKHGTYLLPMKKAVRTAEGLDDGDTARVTLHLIDP